MTSEFQLFIFLLFRYVINTTARLKKTRHAPFKMWWQATFYSIDFIEASYRDTS